jgi:catechol 2,3-dioxygenase-like lactoylglutathione lyase family enzyme
MPIVGLGHTGLWVTDLAKMRDFYERVLGLTVTDADDEQGIVFFSARPDVEHHEFVLQRVRTAPPGSLVPTTVCA